MGKITKYLNQLITGNVFDTPEILEAYSTDQSILKIKPKFVAFPESTEDIRKLMRFFNQIASKDIPASVAVRGSGLDEGGADLTNGLVISTEKLNRLLEIDPRDRLVRVQAGITLKELNTALSVSGLTIPIGGHENDTIGGLIANAPVDKFSHKYGGIGNYVERIETILPNGECLQTLRMKKYAVAKKAVEKTLEGGIYRKMSKILKDSSELVKKIADGGNGLVGYPMLAKVERHETMDLKPLFFGSQGTLGIISEVILRAVPLKKKPHRLIASFSELSSALKFADEIMKLKPREVSIYDLKIIQKAKDSGKNLDGIIRRLEDGYTIFASFDEKMLFSAKKIKAIKETMPRTAKFVFESKENERTLNEFESSLMSYLRISKDGERVPVLTNFYIPPRNLLAFLNDLDILKDKLGLDLELFGSYATSIYNLRPKFKLDDKELNRKVATFLKAGAYVIERQEGRVAGGSPEGRIKALVTNAKLSEPEKKLYEQIKEIFDQNQILNPDVKLGANSRFTLTHFRDDSLPKIMI